MSNISVLRRTAEDRWGLNFCADKASCSLLTSAAAAEAAAAGIVMVMVGSVRVSSDTNTRPCS